MTARSSKKVGSKVYQKILKRCLRLNDQIMAHPGCYPPPLYISARVDGEEYHRRQMNRKKRKR